MKIIEVVEFDTGKVVKTLGPMGDRNAEKCDDGMQHNLNHQRFFTRIVEADVPIPPEPVVVEGTVTE